jgi:O-antigen biosynthesis protein WbqP
MIYRLFGKRALDILLASASLVCLLPILIIIALLIKFFDPGPVIFKQIRIGKNGTPFKFYKFRSMPVNTEDIPSDKIGTVKISRIGLLIRRTSIDELPQLYNILRGDMSIVGPRPPIGSQAELIDARRINGALLCRPGLTGLAQIKSFNGMTVSEKAHLDGSYAQKITFMGDLKIILATFLYLLKPPPIY